MSGDFYSALQMPNLGNDFPSVFTEDETKVVHEHTLMGAQSNLNRGADR